MDEFLRNGQSLLEAAGQRDCADALSILISRDGSIRAIESSDWPLESLALEHGARMAYRITNRAGKLRVEGRSGARSLVLEQAPPPVWSRPRPAACLLPTPAQLPPAHI